MENIEQNYKTWADLKEFVNSLTDEQLAKPLIYWGEDTGGKFTVFQLEEEYVYDGETMSPVSTFNAEDLAEQRAENAATMAKGTPIAGIEIYVKD